MFFMTAHWSKPIDYSDDTMLAAAQRWRYFQGAYLVPRTEPPADEWDRLVAALDEDFNTPAALAVLHDWRSRGFWHLLDRGLEVFGLELPATAGTDIEAERLRQERDLARARKDWQEADHLRDEINRRGFEVQDGPDGSRLIRRR
jgi:cysteinyl-tRNA synthetase